MSARQLSKLVSILLPSYIFAHLMVYFAGEQASTIVEDLLSASLLILSAITAMSFGLFTYVDNMAKELTDLRNEVSRSRYKRAQALLSSLKREVLFNVALIVVLALCERLIKSSGAFVEHERLVSNIWLTKTICISLRFACFTTAICAALVQLRGFVVAVEYREIIAINRK